MCYCFSMQNKHKPSSSRCSSAVWSLEGVLGGVFRMFSSVIAWIMWAWKVDKCTHLLNPMSRCSAPPEGRGAGCGRIVQSAVAGLASSLQVRPCVLLVAEYPRCWESTRGLRTLVFSIQCAHGNLVRFMNAPCWLWEGQWICACLAVSLDVHVQCLIVAKWFYENRLPGDNKHGPH